MNKNLLTPKSSIEGKLNFTYPQLYTGKSWYVGFYSFDPLRGCMRRKKYMLNRVRTVSARRAYARDLIKFYTAKLEHGWNPWADYSDSNVSTPFKEVCDKYRMFLDKSYHDDDYRYDTYVSYSSYLRNVVKYNESLHFPIYYSYQFNRKYIIDFLEYIYYDRDNSATTRDNYLFFLRTFSTWMVQHGFADNKPTDGILSMKKSDKKKKRTIIENEDLIRLHEYLEEKNKYYLLACYILHYCFIRPKEMSMIQLKHISLHNQTVYIPADVSKNRRDGTVTLPRKVIELMIDLNIFNEHTASEDYLFSKGFKPGREYKDEKQFRDFWTRTIRKDLKFPDNYKFYSLKDTGITSMLRKYDTLTVRDQARHSSVLMTDIYTPHDIQKANSLIAEHEGIF